MDEEIQQLDQLAHWVFGYLVLISIISFFIGYYFLTEVSGNFIHFVAISLLGFSGSAIAALTSSLDRYAKGFERNSGEKEPKDAKGETFNRRMARWFFVRPFLGILVAPLFIWGITFFTSNPQEFLNSTQHIAFSSFMAGLLAKSVLELIKGLFKNVFKV